MRTSSAFGALAGFCLAAVGAAAGAAPAFADNDRVAVGFGVSTAGVQGQASYKLSDRFALRGGANLLAFDHERRYDGVDYGAHLEASTVGALLDVRPFANAFTLTGGAYFGHRSTSLEASPDDPVEIGGFVFSADQLGRIVGEVDLGTTAPFVGLGFDNTFTTQRRWGVRLSAGLAVGDKPTVNLRSEGGLFSDHPLLIEQLDAEEANVASDVDILRYYPTLSAGVAYRF